MAEEQPQPEQPGGVRGGDEPAEPGPDAPGWDAECEYCECRMSWSEEEGGDGTTGTRRVADTWGYWHQRECEPSIRLLSPADLDAERASLERARAKFPHLFTDRPPPKTGTETVAPPATGENEETTGE